MPTTRVAMPLAPAALGCLLVVVSFFALPWYTASTSVGGMSTSMSAGAWATSSSRSVVLLVLVAVAAYLIYLGLSALQAGAAENRVDAQLVALSALGIATVVIVGLWVLNKPNVGDSLGLGNGALGGLNVGIDIGFGISIGTGVWIALLGGLLMTLTKPLSSYMAGLGNAA